MAAVRDHGASPEQFTVDLISSAFDIENDQSDLTLAKVAYGAARQTGRWCGRLVYAAASATAQLFSLNGIRSVTAVSAVLTGSMIGYERIIRIVLKSSAVVLAAKFFSAVMAAPESDAELEANQFIAKLAPDDQHFWGSLVQLLDTFNKVVAMFPVVQHPKLAQIQAKNPSEFILRLMALVHSHNQQAEGIILPPQPAENGSRPAGGPADAPGSTPSPNSPPPAPLHHPTGGPVASPSRSAEAVVRADAYLATQAVLHAEAVPRAPHRGRSSDGGCLAARPVHGSAHQRQGVPAPPSVVADLREWLDYTDAAYLHMASEAAIERWLKPRGWQLLLASFENRSRAPVFYAAVHESRREVVVAVRGTMSVNDAVTDMILMASSWGEAGEKVHGGIGASSKAVFKRLRHHMKAFAAAGNKIVIVGHSMGGGVAALLAWQLRELVGLKEVRAVAYAPPPCVSEAIARASREYVTACVMHNDAVPRLAPRSLLALQEEAADLKWGDLAQVAMASGFLGRSLYDAARTTRVEQMQESGGLSANGTTITAEQRRVVSHPLSAAQADLDDATEMSNSPYLLLPHVPGTVVLLQPKQTHTASTPPHSARGSAWDSVAGQAGPGAVAGEPSSPFSADADQSAESVFRGSFEVPESVVLQEPTATGLQSGEECAFECVYIDSDAPTLGTVRICEQAVEDHHPDQYRLGLGLPKGCPGCDVVSVDI